MASRKQYPNFPANVYVTREEEDNYLFAWNGPSDLKDKPDGTPVAIYELTSVRIVRKTFDLEEGTPYRERVKK